LNEKALKTPLFFLHHQVSMAFNNWNSLWRFYFF